MDIAPGATRRAAAATLGRAGLAVTLANAAANLLAYLVPLLAARRLAPADLGALSTCMALVAIATMPGIGLQTAVAVAVARSTDPGRAESGRAESGRAESGRAESGRAESGRAESGRAESGRAESRAAWATAAVCAGALLVATPLIASLLQLSPALPPLLAAITVPAVLAGRPLGVLQGQERFARLAAGTVLLAAARYAGVVAGLVVGADLTVTVALGALVAWSLPPALSWLARPSAEIATPVAGQASAAPTSVEMPKGGGEAGPGGAVRGRAVFSAANASLAILVASYADLILARRLLPPGESGAYAVGAVLTRAAIWAPQVITVLALPRLAKGGGAALRTGLALLAAAGVGLVGVTATASTLAVRAVGGRQYDSLAHLAPYFVTVGALYAVTYFLLNAQLAAGARWPSAGVWAAVAALLLTAAVLRPVTVGELLACAVGTAAASAVATGAAVWYGRGRAVTAAR